MSKLTEWIRHNQGLFVAVLVLIAILVWMAGCQSKVSSLVVEGKKVTRAELNLEIAAETQRLEAKLNMLASAAKAKQFELDRQDAIKQKLFEFMAITAEAGTINASGVVGLIVSVLGVGAVIDNRIKDKVIKNRPLPAGSGG